MIPSHLTESPERTRRPLVTRARGMAALAAGAIAAAVATFGTASEQPVLPRAPQTADYHDHGPKTAAKVALGRALFFDPILSGNRNIACATCHHPREATADGLSLSIGEGGTGIGRARTTGTGASRVFERVPRNSPALFNIGALEYTVFFHDGRVSTKDGKLVTPAGDRLLAGLDNALAAQALFPVTSAAEMAGQAGENPVADAAAAADLPRVWQLLADRLRANATYREMFRDAFGVVPGRITMAHAANAIAAFEDVTFRSAKSPFDRYLAGETGAMTPGAKRGMNLFYGNAGCSGCHSGAFQTDHKFHALGMPQIGPGKVHDGSAQDSGRALVTSDPADIYCFRTPSLRNVELTAPYGHAGAHPTLEGVIRHHLDPARALERWSPDGLILPSDPRFAASDLKIMKDPAARRRIAGAAEHLPVSRLGDDAIADLVAFLKSLTDPAMTDLAHVTPASVPSGLPVPR